MTAPVWAQTITAPGLVGPPACVGQGETDDPLSGSISITGDGNVSLTITAFDNLYSSLRSRVGDSAPTTFTIKDRVRSVGTGIQVEGSFATITSGSPNLNASPSPHRSLVDKTVYVFEVFVDEIDRPLLRRCFMTGGTYTITNLSVVNGSNGCFSISPLTPQDARNCLCGRGATGSVTIDGSPASWNYSSMRGNWGCAN